MKDLIEIDDAGEINAVIYIDDDHNKQIIGNTIDENPMLPEVEDFAKVINNPKNPQDQRDYDYWRQLSVYVNKLIYNLRQDAHISFVGEKQ